MDKEFPTICQMEEGEIGGGAVKKGVGGWKGGFSSARILLYISPGFGNQTQEKPTAPKHSGGLACITYFPPAQTFNDDSHSFVYVVLFYPPPPIPQPPSEAAGGI